MIREMFATLFPALLLLNTKLRMNGHRFTWTMTYTSLQLRDVLSREMCRNKRRHSQNTTNKSSKIIVVFLFRVDSKAREKLAVKIMNCVITIVTLFRSQSQSYKK